VFRSWAGYNHETGRLFERVRSAVANDRYVVGWHADERCEEREVTIWQIVSGLEQATLVRERPRSKPNPSVVVRQLLADGTEIEVVWAWLADSGRAKLNSSTPKPEREARLGW
jgi:hypothetical protein